MGPMVPLRGLPRRRVDGSHDRIDGSEDCGSWHRRGARVCFAFRWIWNDHLQQHREGWLRRSIERGAHGHGAVGSHGTNGKLCCFDVGDRHTDENETGQRQWMLDD